MFYGPHLYHAPPLVLPERDTTPLFSRDPQKVRPNANGSVAWTPSAGTNYECVNETGASGTQQTTSRDFNGSTQYATRSDTCSVSDYPATFAGWFRADSIPGILAGLFGLYDVTNNRRQIVYVFADSTLRLGNQDDEDSATSNTVSTSTWHHFAAIMTSTTSRRMVLDGNWASSGTNTTSVPWLTADEDTAAAADEGGGNPFDGQMAHIAVWNVALSQSEVEGLAGGDNPLAVQNSSLVAYWPLAGTSSPEPDEVGTYDLTLIGSPAQGGSAPDVDPPVEAKNTDYITAASAGLLDSFDVPTYDDPGVSNGFIVRYAVPDAPTGGAGVEVRLYEGATLRSTGPTVYAAGEYQWNVPAADVATITDRAAVRVAVYSV